MSARAPFLQIHRRDRPERISRREDLPRALLIPILQFPDLLELHTAAFSVVARVDDLVLVKQELEDGHLGSPGRSLWSSCRYCKGLEIRRQNVGGGSRLVLEEEEEGKGGRDASNEGREREREEKMASLSNDSLSDHLVIEPVSYEGIEQREEEGEEGRGKYGELGPLPPSLENRTRAARLTPTYHPLGSSPSTLM